MNKINTQYFTSCLGIKSVLVNTILLFITFAGNLQAQQVQHKISDISNSAKHYSYQYRISEILVKDIEYFIIQAPNGEIKTAFNACDVCFSHYKGYSQAGEKMRCNNCGNQYFTNDIGSQGQGGCWPGYLPHTITGDNLVIQISDLIKGAYYFRTKQVSSVPENNVSEFPETYILSHHNSMVSLTTGPVIQREILIHNLLGVLVESIQSNSNNYIFNTAKWVSGIYLMTIKENKNIYHKLFII